MLNDNRKKVLHGSKGLNSSLETFYSFLNWGNCGAKAKFLFGISGVSRVYNHKAHELVRFFLRI